jgi:hypothetical protein
MRPYVVLNYGGELPERTVDESVELRFVPIEEALRSPVPQVRAMVAMATQRSHASSAEGQLSMQDVEQACARVLARKFKDEDVREGFTLALGQLKRELTRIVRRELPNGQVVAAFESGGQ